MSNINLLISGNLTGYSHFYATPNVSAIYAEDKIEFDYRNYLSFLRDGEKAYAISFGKDVVAVSLVIRSLDSFRRPGVIVFTVLMRKGEKVVPTTASDNGTGMYDLLSEVHTRFMQHNYVNGVLNQNLTVLKQDYYTDILDNYKTVTNTNQRGFRNVLDFAAPNKQIGYVVPENDDIAPYLETPCRQNYARYHHVFLAKNAPANIQETAIETILYTVTVTNNGQRIAGVKLSDKIVRPGHGEFEKAIDNMDFTYQQVLEGKAPRIRMEMIGDDYKITYNFPKASKVVTFKFVCDNKDIPAQNLALVCEDPDGSRMPITMNPFTFEGEELRDDKTLMISSNEYGIKRGYERLRISRINKDAETITVQLEKLLFYPLKFENCSRPKKITFIRGNEIRTYENICDKCTGQISGNPEEWTIKVESDYYETVSQRLPKLDQKLKLDLRPKIVQKQQPMVPAKPVTSPPTVVSASGTANKQSAQFSFKDDKSTKTGKKKPNKKKKIVVGALIAAILVIGSIALIWWYVNSHNNEHKDTPEIVQNDVTFHLKYNEDSGIDRKSLQLIIECDSINGLARCIGEDSVYVMHFQKGDTVLVKAIVILNKKDTIYNNDSIKVAFDQNKVEIDIAEKANRMKVKTDDRVEETVGKPDPKTAKPKTEKKETKTKVKNGGKEDPEALKKVVQYLQQRKKPNPEDLKKISTEHQRMVEEILKKMKTSTNVYAKISTCNSLEDMTKL